MKILVYGGSAHGKVIRDLAARCGHEFAGFVDDIHGSMPEVLGGFEEVRSRFAPDMFAIAIGVGYKDLPARWSVVEKVRGAGYKMPALVHPEAYVHPDASIGLGAAVMARTIVDMRVQIGEACVIWPGANVSHDSSVGANTFLSPNCTICGFVSVGRDCFVGAGAVVAEKRAVPDGTRIKAGAVRS